MLDAPSAKSRKILVRLDANGTVAKMVEYLYIHGKSSATDINNKIPSASSAGNLLAGVVRRNMVVKTKSRDVVRGFSYELAPNIDLESFGLAKSETGELISL